MFPISLFSFILWDICSQVIPFHYIIYIFKHLIKWYTFPGFYFYYIGPRTENLSYIMQAFFYYLNDFLQMFPQRPSHISLVVMPMKTIIHDQVSRWSALGVPVVGLIATQEMKEQEIKGLYGYTYMCTHAHRWTHMRTQKHTRTYTRTHKHKTY
jgi:hypothetical protein